MRYDELTVGQITKIMASQERLSEKSSCEMLPVYSTDGGVIGIAPRLICHRCGLLHKVVYCLITNAQGKLLLQYREDKRLDVTIGGHVSISDRNLEIAIIREAKEEIGLDLNKKQIEKIAQYTKISSNQLDKPREINNEIRTLFVVKLTDEECSALDESFKLRDEKGISALAWFSLEEVIEACDREKAAGGLIGSIPHFYNWLVDKR